MSSYPSPPSAIHAPQAGGGPPDLPSACHVPAIPVTRPRTVTGDRIASSPPTATSLSSGASRGGLFSYFFFSFVSPAPVHPVSPPPSTP